MDVVRGDSLFFGRWHSTCTRVDHGACRCIIFIRFFWRWCSIATVRCRITTVIIIFKCFWAMVGCCYRSVVVSVCNYSSCYRS
jgi:hypothetical protein